MTPPVSARPLLIVGAGVQGLTLGLALASRGRSVIVAESSSAVGGQARSFRYGRFTFDLGLHALVTYDPSVSAFVREALGADYTSFYPRAASLLADGRLVEDASLWRFGGDERSFYELFPKTAEQSWNCMLVSKPPPVIYPKTGGFGALFERMARLFTERGGTLLLDTRLTADDFRREGDELAAVRLSGRWQEVSGCYWSVGTYALSPSPRAAARAGGELVLCHFLVDGAPASPYHWVRLPEVPHPLLPRLVYTTTAFAAANAPAGRHGVGAVVPVLRPARATRQELELWRWFAQEPKSFEPMIRDFLVASGLLPRRGVLETRFERLSLPPERTKRSARHPFEDVRNFWDADRWLVDDPRESGVALQIAAALKAADEIEAAERVSC